MEPILNNPQFTKLLRFWEFITSHHDYLELPEKFAQLSLYELNKHVECEKHMTECISQIIEALVKKATGHQKLTKQHSTLLFLARNNKFNFFNDLLKTSFYELGRSQVNFSLVWRGLPEIDSSLPFQSLKSDDKYKYLIWLINLVSTGIDFKSEYLEKVKKQYGKACQQSGKDKVFLHQTYGTKLQSSIILGKDFSNNCYFYISNIHDTIFAFNTKKNEWKKITGSENIKKQVIEKLIQKPNLLTQHSLDLLENINQLWKKFDFPLKHSAFDNSKEVFDLNNANYVDNKLDKIKFKLHELDESYSKFISDCYSFRWASKEKRIAFHEQINEAKQMADLVGCLSCFFHQTKHCIQRKINTIDSYDHNLSSNDQPEDQFKIMYLRMNYLYCKEVFAQNPTSKSFTANLYHHIKNFLELSESFKPYFYEYLTLFIECMLGTIHEMYPGALSKRVKNVQRLKKQKQQRQERQAEVKRKASINKLKKNSQQSSEDLSSDEQGSSTTAEKNQSVALNGRRLRQKVRVNYKTQSRSKSKLLSKQKPQVAKLRHKSKRNQKGKLSKMVLDSDEEQSEVSLDMYESDTEIQDQGLNLDSYKYVEDEETQKFKRILKNSKDRQ